jgi:hypothetical protein
MNPKSTWIWVMIAAVLFAFIFFYERNVNRPVILPAKVMPDFRAADITSVQVLPKGQPTIAAERTNDTWVLTGRFAAQTLKIQILLATLQSLAPAKYMPGNVPDADQRFGFEAPQASLILNPKNYHVLIGDRTPPGDQVYMQVVGTPGVFVVDASWLKLVPQTATNWRETALADWAQLLPFVDRLIVTNAGKILELQANVTNKQWEMNFPVHTRADLDKVVGALQRLVGLSAREFVSDDPKPDLDAYGLQSPDVSVAFFQSTNRMLLLEFGKSPTNDVTLAYARRSDQPSIVTVSRDSFDPWLASHSDNFRDFMDRHLLVLTSMPDSIDVRTKDTNFTFTAQTNGWHVSPPDYLVDLVLFRDFVKSLANLQFTEIAKENVPAQDLADYGLATPVYGITLKSIGTNDTETVTHKLDFGVHDGKVYARAEGESFVYAMAESDLQSMPPEGWMMRDRRVWNFTPNAVARVSVHQGGKVYELIHKGTNSWSLASVGTLDQFIYEPLEEAMYRLGELRAVVWTQPGDKNLEQYGFKETDYQITIELTTGEKLNVTFGKETSSHTHYAMVVLNGETWVFEFPWPLFSQYVQKFLSVPPAPNH